MYKYEFIAEGNILVEFESKIHITMTKPYILRYATFIEFKDTGHVVNLNKVKEVKINGIKHHLRPYAAR